MNEPEPVDVQHRGRPASVAPRYGIRLLVPFIVVAVCVGGGVVLHKTKPQPERETTDRAPLSVSVVEARTERIVPTVELYGETVAGRVTEVRSSVRGEVLRLSPNLRDGGFVERGETLTEIDEFDYKTALIQATTQRDNTRTQLGIARKNIARQAQSIAASEKQLQLYQADLARARELNRSETVTSQYVESKELQVISARDRLDSLRSQLDVLRSQEAQQAATLASQERGVERAERDLADTVVRAPSSGLIKGVTVALGKNIRTDEAIATLIPTSEIELRFTVPNSVVARITEAGEQLVGRSIVTRWVGGDSIANVKGVIRRVAAEVQAGVGGVTVFATMKLPYDDERTRRLRPGLFMQIDMPDRRYDNLVHVPHEAVYDNRYVYALMPDGKLKRMNVEVVNTAGNTVLIDGQSLPSGTNIVQSRLTVVRPDTRAVASTADG